MKKDKNITYIDFSAPLPDMGDAGGAYTPDVNLGRGRGERDYGGGSRGSGGGKSARGRSAVDRDYGGSGGNRGSNGGGNGNRGNGRTPADRDYGGNSNNAGKPAKPKTAKPGSKLPIKKGKLTTAQKVRSVLAVIGTTALAIMMIAVITVCIVAVALTVYVMQFAEDSFDIDLKNAEMNFSSFIMVFDPHATMPPEYDEDGEPVEFDENALVMEAGEEGFGAWVEVKRLSGDENRRWVDYDDIPGHMIDAIIANEDHRFFEHEGVDWYRTVGATVTALIDDRVTGGSTITQQLVKNLTGDDKVNIGRKLREIFRALSLEQTYTKVDILENYMNLIGFGGTSYGVDSAAWYYFDKTIQEVTLAEAAIIAGVIPSPHNYNPYINTANARSQQEIVLRHMQTYGFISYAERQAALREPIRFRRPVAGEYFNYLDDRVVFQSDFDPEENLYFEDTPWDELRENIPYKWNGDYDVSQDWYVDAGLWQVATKLADERGVSYDRAIDQIKNGGYTIYLNVDIGMQRRLEEKARDPYTFVSFYNEEQEDPQKLIQGGFVIMDYGGRVLAAVGGIGEKPGDDCFNRATQSLRPIGSTVKPISVYAPAIDMNILTYSTFVRDVSGRRRDPNNPSHEDNWPLNFSNTPPGNLGSGYYYPTWYAVQQSFNTVAVRTLQKVGFQASYSMLTDSLGISTLDPDIDMNWSPLGLGAFTHGAALHEVTSAFAIFGNGGVHYEPYFFSKVVDHNGSIILEQNLIGTQAVESDSAWIVNRMLKTVVDDPSGSGQYAKIPNIEVVGKTGTSNDMKNLLWSALTPDYVATVRIGYDDGQMELAARAGDGWRSPARIWGEIMSYVMAENIDMSVPRNFSPEPTVIERSYCTMTGFIASNRCVNTRVGYYRPSNVPEVCFADTHADNGASFWAANGDPPDWRPQYN
ncbi:MAG: transglycosylase domain-containing protein [Oscillospiraceae bacterium]|nr:transglycosylase domain-containing protein [Oscillospiraceae bacterium]